VGINALIDKTPEISAGNLLGGSIVLLLPAIPLLGLIGNKINLDHSIGPKGMFNIAFDLFYLFALRNIN